MMTRRIVHHSGGDAQAFAQLDGRGECGNLLVQQQRTARRHLSSFFAACFSASTILRSRSGTTTVMLQLSQHRPLLIGWALRPVPR